MIQHSFELCCRFSHTGRRKLRHTYYFFLYPSYSIPFRLSRFKAREVEDYIMTRHIPKQNVRFLTKASENT